MADMVAGRELDALVAERVMGLKRIGHYGPTKPRGGHQDYQMFPTHEQAMGAYHKHWPAATVRDHVHETLQHWGEDWGPLCIDDYSTDIASAWEIVEKMDKVFALTKYDDDMWFAQIIPGGESGGVTAPLAICFAALAAIGIPLTDPEGG